MANYSFVLLSGPGHVCRGVDELDDGDVKGIAETNESRFLVGTVDCEASRPDHWLVGHDAHGFTSQPAKTYDDLAGKLGLDLQKVAIVGNVFDHLLCVVGFGR